MISSFISSARYFALLLVSISSYLSFSQREYALELLDTLCSPHFDGRGYVNKGDVRAADFLAEELARIGVMPLKNFTYHQSYKFNVNTFPYPIQVVLGDDTLIPGDDYILDPASGTAGGSFKLTEINSENFYSTYGGKPRFDLEEKGQHIYAFNFMDVTDKEKLKVIHGYVAEAMNYFPVMWVTNKKKTWSVGRSQKNYPMIEVDSASYQLVDSVSLKIHNKYYPKYETKNVIGCIPGKKKNKYIVLSAHYDHLGRMGADTYFPGANDNASGCAMLLSIAKHYAQHTPDYSLLFCFFSGEEAGLVGSNYFVMHPYIKLSKIKFVLNIDIMGAADKGITVVNGSTHEEAFNTLTAINQNKNYIPEVKKRGAAANSDHHFFSEAGVPAFFIYSVGSVTNYHDIFDTAENTPLTKFDEVQQLIVDFVDTIR